MATRGRLCNDFSPLQTFDKLNLCIRHLKTKLVLELILEDCIYLIKMELKKYYFKYLSKDKNDETVADEIKAEKNIEEVEENKGSLLATPLHSLLHPHTCC